MRTKRYIAWVALFALALGLMACNKDSDSKKDDGKYTVEISASEGVMLESIIATYDGAASNMSTKTKADGFSRTYDVKDTSSAGVVFSVSVSAFGKEDNSSTMTVKITKGGKELKKSTAQGRILVVVMGV